MCTFKRGDIINDKHLSMCTLAMWYRLMLPTPCSATKRAKGTVRSYRSDRISPP